jgi:beta-lactamase regulating signal transducer with metallopeptidase domain
VRTYTECPVWFCNDKTTTTSSTTTSSTTSSSTSTSSTTTSSTTSSSTSTSSTSTTAMSSTTTPTLSPDHNNSALLMSGVINLILFLVIVYLLSLVFKRSGRWRRRQQRQTDSERLPLLNIATIANSSEQQQPQLGPLLDEQQQQPPSNQQQQQDPEHNDQDDLESIDLLSTSSDQSDPVPPNWFRRMFKKK